MKLSFNWLRDYVNLPLTDIKELASLITKKIAEVEGVLLIGGELKNILVAKIISKNPHPNADKLTIVELYTGTTKVEVVCGAKNLRLSDKVAYAPVGALLPNGLKIKKAKIRGQLSLGMICSESELGLSDDDTGILILEQSAKVGQTLAQAMPDAVDGILEIDNKSITHRPDLWGHFGFARELAALFNLPAVSLNQDHKWVTQGKPTVDLTIETKPNVYKLVCQGLSGIQVSSSPNFIRYRIHRVGLRAINNLVDVTNYIMLDLGQPMHAFDVDKIPDRKMQIKFADQGDSFTSLAGHKLTLSNQDLVFKSGEEVLALCGVIGGKYTAISDQTTQVFLEAGNWEPVGLRKSSVRLALRTDAAQRYEKYIDPELTIFAIDKALQILKLSCPDISVKGAMFIHEYYKYPKILINYKPQLANDLLGTNISQTEQLEFLTRLGFAVSKSDTDAWQVAVPSWRATRDISIAEDLVEEIGRCYGYDKIKPQAPVMPVEMPIPNHARTIERKIKMVLVNHGFYEVFGHPLVDDKHQTLFTDQPAVKLLNPASYKQDRLKISLLPSFLTTIANNQRHHAHFKIFELAKTYHLAAEKVLEKNELVLGLSANRDYQTSFGAIVNAVKYLGFCLPFGDWQLQKADNNNDKSYRHPYLQANCYCQNQIIGSVYKLNPLIYSDLDLISPVFIAHFYLDDLLLLNKVDFQYSKTSKYPPVFFDISVRVANDYFYSDLVKLIKKASPDIFQVKFLDRFLIPKSNDISLTVRIVFRSFHKTFSFDDIKGLQDRVVKFLAEHNIFLKI